MIASERPVRLFAVRRGSARAVGHLRLGDPTALTTQPKIGDARRAAACGITGERRSPLGRGGWPGSSAPGRSRAARRRLDRLALAGPGRAEITPPDEYHQETLVGFTGTEVQRCRQPLATAASTAPRVPGMDVLLDAPIAMLAAKGQRAAAMGGVRGRL
jgi:hypothetical protein